MRNSLLICSFFFTLPLLAASEARLLARASAALLQSLQRAICQELRSSEKNCATTVEYFTYHQLNEKETLWALSWRVNTVFQRKGEDATAMRDVLEKKQVLLLDTLADHFTGVAYFRANGQSIEQITPAAFSLAALNTQHKVVARVAPELIEKGDFSCTLPEKWQIQGVSASDQGKVTLSFIAPVQVQNFYFSLLTLDDTPLTGIKLAACRVENGQTAYDCTDANLQAAGKRQKVTLQLTAEKKLKSTQPVFKIVMQEAAEKKALMQLAIPFKPGPNYLVFAVAGFLFGGLIAVMVMMLKKNPNKN